MISWVMADMAGPADGQQLYRPDRHSAGSVARKGHPETVEKCRFAIFFGRFGARAKFFRLFSTIFAINPKVPAESAVKGTEAATGRPKNFQKYFSKTLKLSGTLPLMVQKGIRRD